MGTIELLVVLSKEDSKGSSLEEVKRLKGRKLWNFAELEISIVKLVKTFQSIKKKSVSSAANKTDERERKYMVAWLVIFHNKLSNYFCLMFIFPIKKSCQGVPTKLLLEIENNLFEISINDLHCDCIVSIE